jgi:hypothetical protein
MKKIVIKTSTQDSNKKTGKKNSGKYLFGVGKNF